MAWARVEATALGALGTAVVAGWADVVAAAVPVPAAGVA